MTVTKDKMVAIDYTLKDENGNVIDTSKDSGALEYIHGRGSLISGLEKELEGKSPDDTFSAVISPAEGYGDYNKDLVITVPREQFDSNVDIEPGMQFQANVGQIVTVTKVEGDEITIDANHPLAGKTLYFDIKVVSVRDATPEELAPKTSGCGGGCGGCGGSCGGGCGTGGDCGCGGCN